MAGITLSSETTRSEHRRAWNVLAPRALGSHYRAVMIQSVRHLLALFVAVFAMAASSLSTVQAANKALEMTIIADGMNASGDCAKPRSGEPDDADAMACPPVCVAPVIAVFPMALILVIASTSRPYAFRYPHRLGRESLPDPHPPRLNESA